MVLHGRDSREPFPDDPESTCRHEHVCPDCTKRYLCETPAPYLPFGDSDEDCRWFEVVVCPDCLKKRLPMAAG